MNRILRLPEVSARTGFGRSAIYAYMSAGEFPRAVKLGARAVGWLEREADRWIAQKAAD
jgi:prophage regulatory protein